MESPVPGALVGKTIRFILGDQFARLKLGDRFFFDLANQAGSFSIGIVLDYIYYFRSMISRLGGFLNKFLDFRGMYYVVFVFGQ